MVHHAGQAGRQTQKAAEMITFKLRITSPDPDSAELLRQALRSAFGDKLTLNKARKGSNPKYAHLDQVLAYGELEFSLAELQAAANAPCNPPAPAPRKPKAYTQKTINLAAPKPRRKKQP